MSNENDEKLLLPHHKQLSLCTTRLAYRQGRKLTAVKVYTVNQESNHLLVFGVPSLNLRQEAKALFSKFGKILQFNLTTTYQTEQFTETYHVVFERIHSARIAKRMIDAKNFYGGSLHVCYAPELETVEETRLKLSFRRSDVLKRLRNLRRSSNEEVSVPEIKESNHNVDNLKLNMGEVNIISVEERNNEVVYSNIRKRKKETVTEIHKPCFLPKKPKTTDIIENNIEVVDCTSVNREVISNINEALNYNKFGDEDIRKVPEKPVNRIKFNLGNKKT